MLHFSFSKIISIDHMFFFQKSLFTFFFLVIATFAYSQKYSFVTDLGNYSLEPLAPENLAVNIPQPFEFESKKIPPFEEYEHEIPHNWSFPIFLIGAEDYFFQGLQFYQKKDWEQSIASFEKAIAEQEPEITQASFYWIGRIWFARNQLNKARESFQSAVNENLLTEYEARSAYAISWILLKRRQFHNALEAIEEFQNYFKKPKFIESILYLKAYAYMSQKNYDETLKVFYTIQKEFPRSPRIISIIGWIGEIAFLKKDQQIITDLIKTYQQALYNYPEMGRMLVIHFWLELLTNNWKEASKSLQTLKQRGLENQNLLMKSEFYLTLLQNQFTNSYKILKKIPPDASQLEWINLARASFLKNDFAFLAKLNTPQLQNYRFAGEHYLLQGIATEKRGQNSKAFKLYDLSINLAKEKTISSAALFNQASNQIKQKQMKAAYKNLQRLVADFSGVKQSSEFFFWLGLTHYQIHKKLYRLAFHQVSPTSSRGDDKLFFLGKFYFSQNNLSQSQNQFQTLTQKYPQSEYINPSYYALTQIAFIKKDYTTTKKLFQKWHLKYPQAKVTKNYLELWVQSTMALKEWDNALALIHKFGHQNNYLVMEMQLDALQQKKLFQKLIQTSNTMLSLKLNRRQKEWIHLKRASAALSLNQHQKALQYYEQTLNYAVAENKRFCYYQIAKLAQHLKLDSKFIQYTELFEKIKIYDDQYLDILLLMTDYYANKKETEKLQQARQNLIYAYQSMLDSQTISEKKQIQLYIQLAHQQTALGKLEQSLASLKKTLDSVSTTKEPPPIFFKEVGYQAFQSANYEAAVASYLHFIYLDETIQKTEKKEVLQKILFAYQQLNLPEEEATIQKLMTNLSK